MGRAIPGQYSVPVKGTTENATIDAHRMTMRIGMRVFKRPMVLNKNPRFVRLSRDQFWKYMSAGNPESVDGAFRLIYLSNGVNGTGRRAIKMHEVPARS
jgi:hypothetical protein